MVRLAVTTPVRRVQVPEGRYPVKLSPVYKMNIDPCLPELNDICRRLWTYLGHAGMTTPWMDSYDHKAILAKNRDKIENFFWYMARIDVDWRSYCFLALPLIPYSKWVRLLLLVNNKQHWYWTKKLRVHAGSSELVDYAADFVLAVMQKQIDTYGMARIKTSAAVQLDEGVNPAKGGSYRAKHYGVYTKLIDRIKALTSQGVDPMLWLDEKFETAKDKIDFIYLATIVNENGFDPDVNSLKTQANDPWRPLRIFLGLSKDCDFPDGSLPKGWMPSKDDFREVKDIRRITKDGFYFYTNGEQRKGSYHYAKNRYHTIACTPENFEGFKKEWKDPRYITMKPTWFEYSQWAVYPDMWNEKGESTNGRIPGVKWRKS